MVNFALLITSLTSMKTKHILSSFIAILAVSCASAQQPSPDYSVNINLTPDEDGMIVYMTDYDLGTKIDSALVEDGIAKFSGKIERPIYVRMILEGERIGDFFLENTVINLFPYNRKVESTGKLHSDFRDMNLRQYSLINRYRSLPEDSVFDVQRIAIEKEISALTDSVFNANANNELGYVVFINNAYSMSLDELDTQLDKYPQLKNKKRIKSLRNNIINKQKTAVGLPYKDFAITNDGTTQRLSDYVGNGHYTLVDFWASWCGPCLNEIKTIKKIYNKYNGKGLEVLGVAVWDEPQNTLTAINEHSIPWKQIINAQTIPTDIYGISGIPCIILIDPNGIIVSRDKQGKDLIDDVEAAMAKMLEESENKQD